jgi:hypothetical protein
MCRSQQRFDDTKFISNVGFYDKKKWVMNQTLRSHELR